MVWWPRVITVPCRPALALDLVLGASVLTGALAIRWPDLLLVPPFFATGALWLVARALTRGDRRSLALAGLGAGLSLQTHPTVAPLLLGAAIGVGLRRPDWLRCRWPYLALLLVVLGYSTLLV